MLSVARERRPAVPRRREREAAHPRGVSLPGGLGWVVIFPLALAIRLAYVFEIRGTPIVDLLLIDSETYDRFARLILAGKFRGEEVYSMNPLYPHFLAGIYAVLGATPWKALLVQAVLSAANAGVIFTLARRWFGVPAAWVAGIAAALYAPYVFYAGALLTPTLIETCGLASLLLLESWLRGRGTAALVTSGFFTGLAALGRGSGILFVALVAPVFRLATGTWRGAARAWAFFALGALGVAGAVTVRNAVVEGGFVPIAANYAAFYLGHHEGANGLYAMHGFDETAAFEGEVLGVRKELSRQAGRDLTQAEASAELFRRGLKWASTHPRQEAVLAATKTRFFWNRTESPTNLGQDFAREFSRVLRALPLHFGIVAPLGLVGLVLTRRRWRELLPLYFAVLVPWLTCVLFFMSAEYRLPAAAILIVFAAEAVVRGTRGIAAVLRPRGAASRARPATASLTTAREAWVGIALLPLFAIVCNVRTPLLVAQTKNRVAFYNFGLLYEQHGQFDRAEEMLRRSLAIDPRFTPALVALAGIENRNGRSLDAARHLDQARRLDPAAAPVAADDQPRIEAERLYQNGRFEQARAAFEAANAHYLGLGRPDDARAMRNNLALTLHKLGRDAEAEATLRGIVAEAPNYAKAYSNLGLIHESRGLTADAIAEYRRALELDPANIRARRALDRLSGR